MVLFVGKGFVLFWLHEIWQNISKSMEVKKIKLRIFNDDILFITKIKSGKWRKSAASSSTWNSISISIKTTEA